MMRKISNQLSLFPRPREPDRSNATSAWWDMHNYIPEAGALTSLPSLSHRLDNGQTLYTVFGTGYVHQVRNGYAFVLLPEHFSGTWQCYANTWLALKVSECNPVTRYGFDRAAFELQRPNLALPEPVEKAFNEYVMQKIERY